ncbi:glycosyltransferase [Candidatus Saccharibacteria bacterium]|nr:glycosyltransferase [Candidatus Saccharibacteria bacterium]
MKIAIASDIYYPMTNGVAVFAHNLAGGLAQRGHQVLVICPSFTGKKHVEVDPDTGVKTAYLTSVRFPFYPDQIKKVEDRKEFLGVELPRLIYKNGIWAAPYPYPEIKKILNEFQPDVIHLQTAETIAIAIRSYAKHYSVPMVATGHAYPDNVTGQFKFLKPVKKPLDTVVKNYMNSFLKHSEYATMPTEMAINDLIPKNRKKFKVPVEALSNGVDLTAFHPGKCPKEILEKYQIEPKRRRMIYVGRVDPEKSISIVVQAFAQVLKKLPDVEFLIVGDGTDRENLEDLVRALKITDNVRFLGRVLPPDLQELYKTGLFFATASETETQGIVLIEAAATGLPLIAVDEGAVRELCQHDRNGILCQPKDVNEIATAIEKLFEDEKLRNRYSAGSLEVAALHDLNRTLSRFEAIYEEAIALKRAETE